MTDQPLSREQAGELFRSLAAADPATEEHDDLAPEVVTGNDRHYYVGFTLKGGRAWLSPDDARNFAGALLFTAEQADARMTDDARAEQ